VFRAGRARAEGPSLAAGRTCQLSNTLSGEMAGPTPSCLRKRGLDPSLCNGSATPKHTQHSGLMVPCAAASRSLAPRDWGGSCCRLDCRGLVIQSQLHSSLPSSDRGLSSNSARRDHRHGIRRTTGYPYTEVLTINGRLQPNGPPLPAKGDITVVTSPRSRKLSPPEQRYDRASHLLKRH
jgi:hypothetical protein